MVDAESQDMLEAELSMVQSMYPDQIQWTQSSSELHYSTGDASSSFTLRLPEDYPGKARPEVLVATIHKQDARDKLQRRIRECELELPILDVIVEAFDGMASEPYAEETVVPPHSAPDIKSSLTAVIWLHHLLNTNKRKQALSPVLEGVSGISKPGYPGVLVFSGPASAVSRHVEELKSLRWQGFQIRLEIAELWRFQHGSGVAEVESMADVVGSVDADKKDTLLQAIMRQ